MKKSKALLVLAFMLVVVTTLNTAFAVSTSLIDATKKGSLKITALNEVNGETSDPQPMKDVQYSLYRVDEVEGTTVTTVAQAENAIKSLTATAVKTTGTDGVAEFTQLTLGRYYAKVTSVPTGVSNVPESFILDVPMTNKQGTGWVYDITVSPKVRTALGNAILTKVNGAQEPMQGVEFKVQISTDATTWTDYVPEGETSVKTLTTDVNGQVSLENYPISYRGENAKFRLVETSVPDAKYIIDNKNLDYFYAQADGKTIVVCADGSQETPAEVGQLRMMNEKPQISKKASGNLDVISANATDTIGFNVTLDVPSVIADMKTFKMVDTLSAGLTGRSNIVVKGLIPTGSGEEVVDAAAYTKTESGKVLTVSFVPEKIAKYSAIVITYDAKLDMANATLGTQGNTNTAEFIYTNKIDVDGEEESINDDVEVKDEVKVVTGGVKIHKVDSQDNALQGAKFKIATSEANAKAGVFVKDEAADDIEVTSDATGYATISGLAYNNDETAKDYWLVETQAPTFVDGEETKSYTLLADPVKVSVSGTSHTVDVKVVNKKPYNLPLTGGIGATLFIIVGVSLILVGKSIKKEQNVR